MDKLSSNVKSSSQTKYYALLADKQIKTLQEHLILVEKVMKIFSLINIVTLHYHISSEWCRRYCAGEYMGEKYSLFGH